jgi:hypothetical protein
MYTIPPIVELTSQPYLKIYNCFYNQHHICGNIRPIIKQIKNITSSYNASGNILNQRLDTTFPNIPGEIINEKDYDIKNISYYKYTQPYITNNVLNTSFVFIKVLSNTIETVQYMEDAIHEYKTQIEMLETNIRIYLLNKNSKHMIMYNKSFLNERNNIFSKKIDLNTNKYNVYFQAINIRNLELLYNFYIHLCLFLFIGLIFVCLLLLNFFPNYSILIIIVSFIIGLIIFIIILYNLLRRQRIYTNKYYFAKPDKYV